MKVAVLVFVVWVDIDWDLVDRIVASFDYLVGITGF
jgi:hypothetical protein